MIAPEFVPEIFEVPHYEETEFPHEAGHQWGVRHAPCGGAQGADEYYPYANAALGPARSWSLNGGFFVGPDDGYSDVMSYCRPRRASDFTYQQMALYFQSDRRVEEVAQWGQCGTEESGAESKSLAVSGIVRSDGSLAITGTAPSTLPPRSPRPGADADFWLTVTAGGTQHHREPLVLSHPGHRRPSVRAVWSARVPAAPHGPTGISVRSGDGAVLAETTFERLR